MKGKFLFLGTGGSLGIPVIGCKCPICQSDKTENRRMRSSALLKVGKKNFLIDAGPDFHAQALKYNIEELEGVMLTHTHYDHIAGIDELRIFYFKEKKPVPVLVSKETLDELKVRYHYIMPENSKEKRFHFEELEEDFGEVTFKGLKFELVSYFQGGMKVNGYRFGKLAYLTDVQAYSQEVIACLEGVETLVLSALRWTSSPVHFNIDDALEFASRVGAKQTYFTHIAHDLDHFETNKKLPEGIALAYDGLELDL